MPSVEAGDIRIFYEIHGEGEPLLLISGLGTDLSAWIFQVRDFSAEYRTIVFDNRDAGRTDISPGPYTVRTLARDVAALMDALGIERAHVLGLSMGGYIAQELALERPERIGSLILANTAARLDSRGQLIVDTWSRMVSAGIDRELFVRARLPWIFTGGVLNEPGKVDAVLRATLSNPYVQSPEGYRRQVEAVRGFDVIGRLGEISAPALVVAGWEDLLVPVRFSQELAAGIPGAELVVLEGGHALFAEFHEAFDRAVLEFLRGDAR